MKKFEEKESYKHLFSKNLVTRWFREQEKNNDYCKVAQFEWRRNYGVFEELKFYETSDPYYFESSLGLDYTKRDYSICPTLWFDESVNRGKILFVPDITVFHKGTPRYLLEIYNTHHVSDKKAQLMYDMLDDYCTECYEINANEILKCINNQVPDFIKCRQIF